MKDVKVQDAIAGSWVDIYAPIKTRPYLRLSRLDRPVGAWLLFLPCVFGALLAAVFSDASLFELSHVLIVCAVGSWLMRGAGCTWNDIVDRKIDAQVERTKSRPIPSGQVSVRQAFIWMCAQMVVAAIGLLTFDPPVIFLTLGALVIVAAYPFAKRFTNWPQLVLGLCFNWGALTAWMQLTGELSVAAMTLYIAMIFWTLYYDTVYAYQDVEDDALIGVKSSARALGENPKPVLALFLATSFVFAIIAHLSTIGASHPLFYIGLAIFFATLCLQLTKLDTKNGQMCLRAFRQNVTVGRISAGLSFIAYLIM